MADEGSGSKVIAAPLEVLWAVATDVERYPEWAADVRSVEVTARDGDGRPASARFVVGAFGLSTTYEVAYTYDHPSGFSWTLVHSNEMRRMDGSYRFDDRGDGTVEVTYLLRVDLRIPVIGLVKRRAERTIVGHALDGLRKEAERRQA